VQFAGTQSARAGADGNTNVVAVEHPRDRGDDVCSQVRSETELSTYEELLNNLVSSKRMLGYVRLHSSVLAPPRSWSLRLTRNS